MNQGQTMLVRLCKIIPLLFLPTWREEAKGSNVFPVQTTTSAALRLHNSSISKVKHTKGKFPIKILIKFNPSTQSSVTNCLVSAGLASASSSAVPWLIMCFNVQSRLSPTSPHLIFYLCHDKKCPFVHFFFNLQGNTAVWFLIISALISFKYIWRKWLNEF